MDGVISDDSDSLCYGAKVRKDMYKNYIKSKIAILKHKDRLLLILDILPYKVSYMLHQMQCHEIDSIYVFRLCTEIFPRTRNTTTSPSTAPSAYAEKSASVASAL